ncbi:preQ(1) synthase [Thermodesulfobium sp. 4217-1]|uniref:preQ(1) synthase n=1 Tax=Thermodesulfobium sp. 4217-1 TaxID=3120013 RepID=UPI0032215648
MPEASGKIFEFKDESYIMPDFLEGFEFMAEEYIKIETNEFSAVCPFSGLPDIGKLIIEYFPDGGFCVELKSLKYYLISFRNVGIYQEAATKKIFDDLKKLLKTDRIKITLVYNTRGGMDTLTSMGSL